MSQSSTSDTSLNVDVWLTTNPSPVHSTLIPIDIHHDKHDNSTILLHNLPPPSIRHVHNVIADALSRIETNALLTGQTPNMDFAVIAKTQATNPYIRSLQSSPTSTLTIEKQWSSLLRHFHWYTMSSSPTPLVTHYLWFSSWTHHSTIHMAWTFIVGLTPAYSTNAPKYCPTPNFSSPWRLFWCHPQWSCWTTSTIMRIHFPLKLCWLLHRMVWSNSSHLNSAEAVAQAFLTGWISRFGVPSAIYHHHWSWSPIWISFMDSLMSLLGSKKSLYYHLSPSNQRYGWTISLTTQSCS